MSPTTVTVTTYGITEEAQVIPAGPDTHMLDSVLLSNIVQYQDIVRIDDNHITEVVTRSGRIMVTAHTTLDEEDWAARAAWCTLGNRLLARMPAMGVSAMWKMETLVMVLPYNPHTADLCADQLTIVDLTPINMLFDPLLDDPRIGIHLSAAVAGADPVGGCDIGLEPKTIQPTNTPTRQKITATLSGQPARDEYVRLTGEGWINPALSMPAVMVRAARLVLSEPLACDMFMAGDLEQLLVMAGQAEGMRRGLMVPPLISSQLVALASLPA